MRNLKRSQGADLEDLNRRVGLKAVAVLLLGNLSDPIVPKTFDYSVLIEVEILALRVG